MTHQMALMHSFKTSFKIVQNLKRLMVTYILKIIIIDEITISTDLSNDSCPTNILWKYKVMLVTNFNQPVPQVTQHTSPQQSKFTNNNKCYHFIYEYKIF